MELSKWATTQAVRETACPKCAAQPGEDCHKPSGCKSAEVHGDREKAYRDAIGPEEYDKRHKCVPKMAASAILQRGRIDSLIKGMQKGSSVTGTGNSVAGDSDSQRAKWRD